MRPAVLVVAMIAAAATGGTARAADYHVDAVAGDDVGGTGSEAAPWKSLAALGTASLGPGDRVFLKRGSVFRERLKISASGTAEAPISVGAYGAGADPVVSAGHLIPKGTAWVGPTAAGEYTLDVGATTVFYTSLAVLVRAAPTGVGTYALLARGTAGALAADTYEARAASGRRVLYVKPPTGTHPTDYDYELSKRGYALRVEGDHVEVRGVAAILGNDGHATFDAPIVTGTIGATGKFCTFGTCRAAFSRGMGLYLEGTDSTVEDSVAEHNHSTGIVIQGRAAVRNTIVSCTSRYNGNLETGDLDRGGIGVQGDDAIVRGNTIHDNGNAADTTGPRVAGDAAIQVFDCARAVIEHNTISSSVRSAIDMSYTARTYGHRIAGNVVRNWNLVGEASTLKTMAINVLGFGDTASSGTATVVNNTIYSDQASTFLIGIQVGLPAAADTLKGTVVANNIVSMPLNTNPGSVGLRLTRAHRFTTTTIDYNCVHVPLVSGNAYFYADASGDFWYATSEALALKSGFEAHGTNAAPSFAVADPVLGADFELARGSALIDAGAEVGVTADFSGRPVPAGAAPDIGALEFQFPPIEVVVDVVPGSAANPLPIGGVGTLAVAVLGGDAFDVEEAVPASFALSDADSTSGVAPVDSSTGDIDGDGTADLLLHFDIAALVAGGGVHAGTTVLVLTGLLADGTIVYGEDGVTIITTVEVSVDVRPGSSENPLNLTSKGMLPVAVMGSADVDASAIVVASLALSDARVAAGIAPASAELVDLDDDGHADLLLKFDVEALVDAGGVDATTTALRLTGTLTDGTSISGDDAVRIVPPKSAGHHAPGKGK